MNSDAVLATLDVWHRSRHLVIATLLFVAIFYYILRQYLARRYSRRSPQNNRSADLNASEKPKSLYEDQDQRQKSSPNSAAEIPTARASRSQGSKNSVPKRVQGTKHDHSVPTVTAVSYRIQPVVFYFSLTESTRKFASQDFLTYFKKYRCSTASILDPILLDINSIAYEDYFERPPDSSGMQQGVRFAYVLLLPSYDIDTDLDNFMGLLKETHNDFRIDTAPLRHLVGYAVFGFGDSEGWPTVQDGFCAHAIEADKWMAKLTDRKRMYPLALGDVKSGILEMLDSWTLGLCQALQDVAQNGDLGEGVPGSGDALESDDEEIDTSRSRPSTRITAKKQSSNIGDLEDLGRSGSKDALATDITSAESHPTKKAMVPVSSPTHAALTKQGYTIVGTHSGVKICRWTKSALRGRGSCYKYSFYGIQSHLCMETTPSLSCSNKCVFCWRHGTNPVGTTWRWQVDPPDMIFAGAKEGHYKKIKMMRGVPGVRAERYQAALRIRHCALSLVGEPIFYPHINQFLALLHNEHISSFLVCNAQHPDQLQALKAVTQLYVSIDASNAESLRKIDRPLHRDFWERFLRCLAILREKRFTMRTVYRLTLVKGFNIDEEVEGYADLVARGLPCFVEIKGVTYCGTSTSKSAGLTMQNVPFWAEIVAFVEALSDALNRRGLEYGIAAEHAHSCCALIGSRRFFVQNQWHTLIDYDRFFDCLESGKEFSPEDYMGPATPEWALWGNGGFDPRDTRVDRKGRPIESGK